MGLAPGPGRIAAAQGAVPQTPAAIVRALQDAVEPAQRDALLDALARHGGRGIDALRKWWRRAPRSEVASTIAQAAPRLGTAIAPLLVEILRRHVAEEAVARALVALPAEPAVTDRWRDALAAASTPAAQAILLEALGAHRVRQARRQVAAFVEHGRGAARVAAAAALGQVGSAQDVALLRRVLGQPAARGDVALRRAIYASLGRIGGPDALSVLTAALDDAAGRDAVLAALARMGPQAARALGLMLKSAQGDALALAARALLALGDAARLAEDAIVDTLFGGDRPHRRVAVDLLVAMGASRGAVARIGALLPRARGDVAVDLVDALVSLGGEGALTGGRAALEHPDAAVRAHVLQVSASQAWTALQDDVVAHLDADPDAIVRRAAARWLLAAFATDAADALARAAERDAAVRIDALDALGWLGAPAQAIRVAQLAQSTDPDVRRAALQAWTRIVGVAPDGGAVHLVEAARALQARIEALQAYRAREERVRAAAPHGATVEAYVAGRGATTALLVGDAWSGGADALLPLARALASGWRVVRVVLPGRGDGPAAARWRQAYRLDDDVAAIEAVRAALGVPSVVLVGHGAGAVVATAYAARHGRHVRALVAIESGPPVFGWAQRPGDVATVGWLAEPWRRAADALAARGGGWSARARVAASRQLRWAAWAGHLDVLPVLRALVALPPGAEAAREAIVRAWGRYDLRRDVASAPWPVLYVVGERTPLPGGVRDALQALAQRRVGIRVTSLDGVGHWAPAEVPEQVAALVRTAAAGFED